MATIITTYGLEAVVIIIAAFISFAIGIYKGIKELIKNIKEDVANMNKINDVIAKVDMHEQQINTLLYSDMIQNQGTILKSYLWFAEKGYIDINSLKWLDDLYDIYKKEGGNSFVEDIMEKVHKLEVR